MREVQKLLTASAKKSQKLSLMAVLVTAPLSLTLACGSDDPIVGDLPDRSEIIDNAKGDGSVDAGTGRDNGKADGASKADSSTITPGGKDAGATKDAGSGRDLDNCGRSGFSTGAVVPDMLIALDRSGSMKPGGNPPNLRCDMLDPFDFPGQIQCAAAGIDCSRPADQATVYCGGTQMRGPVDRWTPSVAAVTTLTKQFDQDVSFGLMTFPAASNECGPGDLKVPIGLGTSAEIEQVLQNTQPGGGTPTGETLQAALKLFEENPTGADTVAPVRYVLLVTDGQPTCPNSNGGSNRQQSLDADKRFTLDALDALRDNGIKTFVVGYDAELDDRLANALTEFAQHGGTDDYFPVQNEQSLIDAFKSISEKVITCAFEFKKDVTDPALVHVTLDGVTLAPNQPNGWTIDGNVVTVQGESCAKLQGTQGHAVEIVMECEPVVYM
jgi:hypothetical protein